MRVLTYLIRVSQRLSITLKHSIGSKRALYAIGLSLFILIGLVSFYHDESYQITTDSLQSLNESINSITSRIDSWNKLEQNQKPESDVSKEAEGQESSSSSSAVAISTKESKFLDDGKDVEVIKPYEKENGVILIFGRNNDLFKLQETVRSIEERFNRAYQYDYLIVSDSVHSENFKRGVSAMTTAKLTFHNVPRSLFAMPSDVDKGKLKEQRKKLKELRVAYTKAQRVKHTQRFWAKEIFNIEPLKQYDYFLRIEAGASLYCDMPVDYFKFMKEQDKTLGFGFALRQDPKGFLTLWDNVLKYIEENPEQIANDTIIDFISDDKGISFNGCQFRTSFEVGKLSFFQGEKYQKFAEYLDKFYGIYYETWDDSTFHTLGVSLFENRDQVQFFNHLGYHDFNTAVKGPVHKACPIERDIRLKTKCTCNPIEDVTWADHSCVSKFFEINNVDVPESAEKFRNLVQETMIKQAKADEQKKYEEEQLQKEKEKEQEEKKKIAEDLKASMPEMKQQEGDEISPESENDDE